METDIVDGLTEALFKGSEGISSKTRILEP